MNKIISSILLFSSSLAYALPFSIIPKVGTSLPTLQINGNPEVAFYTVTNNTSHALQNNFVKYLPAHVTQVTSDNNIPGLCGASFNLQPAASCTLELSISGTVDSQASDPHQHLFVCNASGISCAGTTLPLNVSGLSMVAVGLYQDRNFNFYPGLAIPAADGKTWRMSLLSNTRNQGLLSSVSCSGANCLAVGYNLQNYPDLATISAGSRDAGNSWGLNNFTLPNGHIPWLQGVHCSDSHCIAVGSKYSNTNSAAMLIANTYNYGVSYIVEPVPAVSSSTLESLVDVNCNSQSCAAVGYSYGQDFIQYPLLAKGSSLGTHWSKQTLTLPPGYSAGYFSGIDCTSHSCIAVGSYFTLPNNNFNQPAIAINSNGSNTWRVKFLPIPNFNLSQGTLSGISCVEDHCVTVGEYNTNNYSGYPFIAVSKDGGETWPQNQQILFGLTYNNVTYREGYFNSVQCVTNKCVALGYFIDTNNKFIPFYTTSSDGGSSWPQDHFKVLNALPSNFNSSILFKSAFTHLKS